MQEGIELLVILVLSMIALGATNRYRVLPGLRACGLGPSHPESKRGSGLVGHLQSGPVLMRKFMGKVALEAGLVVAVLACVVVLIHEMPPRGMVHSAEQHMQR